MFFRIVPLETALSKGLIFMEENRVVSNPIFWGS